MMKHLICTILIAFLLPVSVFASTTDKRALTEFCELYAERLLEIQGSKTDYDIPVYSSVIPLPDTEKILIGVTAGNLEVYKDTLEICGASFTVYDLTADSDKNAELRESFIAAFSALEYSYQDDSMFRLHSKINGGLKDCAYESMRIFNDELLQKINDGIKQISKGDSTVTIYSGNYDYSLEYKKDEIDGRPLEDYWIVAQERK